MLGPRNRNSSRDEAARDLAAIRSAARNVLAKGDGYRAFLVVAMDDVFSDYDPDTEALIGHELNRLRTELEKAAVYDTDEFERLNSEAPARWSTTSS